MSNGAAIGVISVTRVETGSFADQQVQLLQTFADQAVIAIENVRLFDEVQAKTDDLPSRCSSRPPLRTCLKVISRSTFDLQPVLDTLLETAARLCETRFGFIFKRDGDEYRLAATHGISAKFARWLNENPPAMTRGTVGGRTVIDKRIVHVHDVLADPDYQEVEGQSQGGYRTVLGVPLLRGDEAIGAFTLAHMVVKPFTEKQIELVTTFADQAVIAIENVRLFEQVQARTEDLRESLQQQTATAEVLKVISRSAFDLQTVLDTLTESAARLCNADMAAITRQNADGSLYYATSYNFPVDWVKIAPNPLQPGRGSVVGRVLLATKAEQIADVLADPEYAYLELQKAAGYRTLLGVPLLRLGQPTGVLFLARKTVEPFTDKQIELVSTFADQAVIAIENVRLFDEVQAKTRDLSEALTYQTGSGNILKRDRLFADRCRAGPQGHCRECLRALRCL